MTKSTGIGRGNGKHAHYNNGGFLKNSHRYEVWSDGTMIHIGRLKRKAEAVFRACLRKYKTKTTAPSGTKFRLYRDGVLIDASGIQ